ncbi:MAG: MurT ligase domain-containing protein [bacterium]|nr:MurT ligase domain-containing protein [bacterium]MDZ4247657.1 MurT ligase domain-containing protein [Patescibacteria group bacterium]
MRNAFAGILSRALAAAAKLRGGGATSLPGLAALRLDPGFIRKRAAALSGSIVITGTNGKTTTSRFIGNAFAQAGRPVVHNQSGSNLLRGIASILATTKRRGGSGRGKRAWGIFEVDEATMPDACRALKPRVVVVTNLFRDQLDRYGELKRTAEYLRTALVALPKSSTVILNADDPLVAALGQGLRCRVRYFGIEDTAHSRPALPHAADAVSDPKSGALLRYTAVFVGHLGHYRGTSLRRPKPQVRLTRFRTAGDGRVGTKDSDGAGSLLTIRSGRRTVELPLQLPGMYNAYNALAALAGAEAAKVGIAPAAEAIAGTAAVFGRQETVEVDGRHVVIGLIKNPTGANEVIRTLSETPGKKRLLVLINDNFADGRDVSWLWDTDFEALRGSKGGRIERLAVGGRRGSDMALRLKYAGFDTRDVPVYEVSGGGGRDGIDGALRQELAATPDGGTLHVFPTYTAMLELRRALTRAGHVKHYLD